MQADWNVGVIALSGMDFELSTAMGKLMLTFVSGISEFERDLPRERTLSGFGSSEIPWKEAWSSTGSELIR